MNTTSNPEHNSKLQVLFETELKYMYWTELVLLRLIAEMIDHAKSRALKGMLIEYLAETHRHISNIERVFVMIGRTPEFTKCSTMNSLVNETRAGMEENKGDVLCDAKIIVSAQKIEHYAIVSYGSLRTFAATLGYAEPAAIFEENLRQEKAADGKLTRLATHSVNEEAANERVDQWQRSVSV